MTANQFHRAPVVYILCITFLLLLTAGFTYPSEEENPDFKIFKVTMEGTTKKASPKPVKDFYVNAGSENGLSNSMILDVYREKQITDKTTGNNFDISIPVGKVKVFKLYKNLAITRLHSLTTSKKTPVLEYRTVMIGDYVIPRVKKKELKQLSSTSKDNTSVAFALSVKQLSGKGVILPSNVLFKLSDWKLKPEALEILSTVNDIYNKSKDKDIIIEGHTCSLGTYDHNLELSRKRAQTVADYFKKTTDIPAERILIEYHGEKLPIASNTTKEGRQKNRRVIIRFIPHYSKSI
jgi:outer membrane protein OmpA-like peptidoglycan-associated protein